MARAEGAFKLGDNLKATIEGSDLVIRINLKQTLGPSASGKTTLVASTRGNQEVPGTDGLLIGVNAYKRNE